jgi:hypothetical protein
LQIEICTCCDRSVLFHSASWATIACGSSSVLRVQTDPTIRIGSTPRSSRAMRSRQTTSASALAGPTITPASMYVVIPQDDARSIVKLCDARTAPILSAPRAMAIGRAAAVSIASPVGVPSASRA